MSKRKHIVFRIEYQEAVVRAAESDAANPKRLDADIAAIDEQLANLNKRREALVYRRDNVESALVEAKAELKRLRAQVPIEALRVKAEAEDKAAQTKAKKDSLKLIALMKQIESLQ